MLWGWVYGGVRGVGEGVEGARQSGSTMAGTPAMLSRPVAPNRRARPHLYMNATSCVGAMTAHRCMTWGGARDEGEG
jgi:hypothetical protein